MSRYEELQATTLEEALRQASERARRPRQELRYRVVQERRGFLGVVPHQVRIVVEAPDEPLPSPRAAREARGAEEGTARSPTRAVADGRALPGTDVPPAQVPESEPEEGEAEAPEAAEQGWGEPEEDGRARYADETEVDEGDRAEVEDLGPEPSAPEVLALVRGILADAGLVVSVDLTEERDRLVLNLSGADRDLLLERRGEGLDALQYLATRVARKTLGTRKRIRLESDGFRLRREDELRTMARDAAERAHRRGEAVWLPALNPYERRIVHLEVASLGGVTSKSDGDGFVKRVSVRSTATAPRGARGGRGRRPR